MAVPHSGTAVLTSRGSVGSTTMYVCLMTHYDCSAVCTYLFQQLLSRHVSALTYLLRVNPLAVMANLSCNLRTGERSTPPEASRCVQGKGGGPE